MIHELKTQRIARMALLTICCLFLRAAGLPRTARAGTTPDSQPEIFCEFSSDRAPIDRERVTLFVDGRDVTSQARIQAWRVSYVPPAPLAPGVHSVRVVVKDLAGSAGEKAWDFTIDPDADAATAPLLAFAPPTPANGSALIRGDVSVSVQAQPGAAVPDPQTLRTRLFRDGAPAPLVPTWRSLNGSATLDLPGLAPGHYALSVSAAGARGITTAFTVDTQPPQITAFEIIPDRIDAQGHFSVRLTVSDTPANNLSECILYFQKQGAPVAEKHVRAANGTNDIMLRARDMGISPQGEYTAGAECVDAAGHRTASALNPRLTVSGALSQLSGLDATAARNNKSFFIDPLPRTVDTDRVAVRGQGPAGADLILYVNSIPTHNRRADASGEFRFDAVALAPGDNEIMVAAEDASGLPAAETAPVTVVYEPAADEPFAVADNNPDMLATDETIGDDPPVVDDPATANPVDDPMMEPPVVEDPVVPDPIIDEPAIEEPIIEDPDPVIEEPAMEDPVIQDPVIEEPAEDPVDPELTIQAPGGADRNQGTVPIHGTAPPGLAVTLYLNGNAVASATANNGGQFHFQRVDLAVGDNELHVTAIAGGVEFRSPSITIVRETQHTQGP